MIKPKYYTHTLVLLFLFLLVGCKSCGRLGLEDSIITEEKAIEFRNNFLYCPNEEYHIPEALMFETEEFQALFAMQGIDKIRLYPAINTHNNPDDDTLTLIMVPVNASNNTDNFSGYLFEYAKPCPSNCTTPSAVPVQAPTEEVLGLNIPKNWCVARSVIKDVMTAAEQQVGEGNVYGIRFYWYNNDAGIMDLELKPTTKDRDGLVINIEGLSYKGVTEICVNGEGCCDTKSRLYQHKRKEK